MAEQKLLVAADEYLKAGLHIGTKFRTKFMEPFIYKVRNDSLAVLNVQKINERIELAAKFLSEYSPDEILVICRRENGYKAVKEFSEATGIKSIVGRYPPGMLTNPKLETFTETKLLLAADPWPDKNAVKDAVSTGIPIIALCDTNNESNFIDLMVPCNNKGKKSLALLFWILAREYLKNRKIIKKDSDFKKTVDDFTME